MRRHASLFIVLLLVSLIYGCSANSNENPTSPDEGAKALSISGGTTACLGFWQVTVDKDAGTIEAVDMRSSDLILNVLSFLEPPAMKGMTVDFGTLNIDEPGKIIEVDIILTHPIPDPVFMGFDVRGVVFGPEVANADGLTVIPSPEFFAGVPFGYQDGLLGVSSSVAHYTGLAGYKYFCDGLGKDADLVTFMTNPSNLYKRGRFSQSPQKNTRHYILDWNKCSYSFFVFNYAIYANYDWPVGSPPIDIDDFDIAKANSQEAFCCKVTELDNSLYYAMGIGGGGEISLKADIWDWQGNISNVSIESLTEGIIPESFFDVCSVINPYCRSYEFNDVAGYPTKAGDLDILVTVTDWKTFGESWFSGFLPASNSMYGKKVYNCFIYTATVSENPPPIIWNPTVALAASYNQKVRATDPSVIGANYSSYQSLSKFTVTGSYPTSGGGGPYSYEYYISTSSSSPTGSSVGWLSFTFGTDITVSWIAYSAMAPDRVYLFVRASEAGFHSTPVSCPTEMRLSRVAYQITNPGTWSSNGSGQVTWNNAGSYGYFHGTENSSDVYRTAYTGPVALGSSMYNTFEFFVPVAWNNGTSTTQNYMRVSHGATSGLGFVIGTIYGDNPYQGLFSYSMNGVTGDRYIGFYAYKGFASILIDAFDWYINMVAIYENPA